MRLLDAGGRERHVFVPGETLTLALSVRAASPVSDFVFGIGLFAADGTCVYGTNTDIEDFTARRLEGESEVRLTLEGLRLVEGTYLVDLAAHKRDGTPYDYLRGLHSFRVKSRVKDTGIYRPQHHWSFTRRRRARPAQRARRDWSWIGGRMTPSSSAVRPAGGYADPMSDAGTRARRRHARGAGAAARRLASRRAGAWC